MAWGLGITIDCKLTVLKKERYSHSSPSSDELGPPPFHAPLCGGEPGALGADAHSCRGHRLLWVDKFLPQKAHLSKE